MSRKPSQKGCTSLRLTSLQATGFIKLPKPSQNCSISKCEPICLSKAFQEDRRDRDQLRKALNSSTWFCLTILHSQSSALYKNQGGILKESGSKIFQASVCPGERSSIMHEVIPSCAELWAGIFVVVLSVRAKILLCNLGWPWTRDPVALASRRLGLQVIGCFVYCLCFVSLGQGI